MLKTLMLQGEALAKAKEYSTKIDETNNTLKALHEQMDALRTAAGKQLDSMVDEMKKLAGVDADTAVTVDVGYIDAHGVAFMAIREPHPIETLFAMPADGGERTLQ